MTLSGEQLKKIELTVDDGRLDCGKTVNGEYSCAEITPVKNITGVCVDDQTNVGVTGRVEMIGESFATDDWDTIVMAIESGTHPYSIGDRKEVYMGEEFGTRTVRLANLSTPAECSTEGFSQTACGAVIEFADVITEYKMNDIDNNVGGWPASKLRAYINNNIYNALPGELKAVIIDSIVVSSHGSVDSSNFVSTDKLYLLSTAEVWQNGTSNNIYYDSARENTRQLDYYNNSSVTTNNYSAVQKKINNSAVCQWWLRSAQSSYSYKFFQAMPLGKWSTQSAYSLSGVSPAFRIG